MRIIQASRCRLEPQVVAHAKEMFEVLSDPTIYEFENAPPASEAWLMERFARLESRTSKDGNERWLNWVVRLPSSQLVGYTQATVKQDGVAYVAYELASRFWRQGLGSCAVNAMLSELSSQYEVHTFLAVLKSTNFRSVALLNHLGFSESPPAQAAAANPESDEIVMSKPSGSVANAA